MSFFKDLFKVKWKSCNIKKRRKMVENSDLYTMQFKIADIFPHDNILARHMVRIFLIINQLTYVHEKFIELQDDESINKEGKSLFLLRLNCSLLREAMKLFSEAEKNHEFLNLLSQLPAESKEMLDEFRKFYEPYNGSFTELILKPVRDNFFHFIDDSGIESLLKKNAQNISEIIFGRRFKDLYVKFADDISSDLLVDQLKKSGLTLIDAIKDVSRIGVIILKISEQLMTIYLKPFL